jgi:hypothetical protein
MFGDAEFPLKKIRRQVLCEGIKLSNIKGIFHIYLSVYQSVHNLKARSLLFFKINVCHA